MHPYYIAKARAAFASVGGDPDASAQLAQWARQARADGAPIQAISVYAPWVTDDNFLLGSKTLLDTLNLSEDKLRLRG